MKSWHICILGSSGLVGQELQALLLKSSIKHQLTLFDRNASYDFKDVDIIFLCTPNAISRVVWQEVVKNSQALVIDLSSAHRDNKDVALVCSDVNLFDISPAARLIANPNCIVNILLPVINPLHQEAGLLSMTLSTYQAASGAGKRGLSALESGESGPFTMPIKNNLFCHESETNELGFCSEEEKIIQESRKILHLPELPIQVRSVRVAIERAHSIAVWLTFKSKMSVQRAREILAKQKGIELVSSANPLLATNKHEIFVSSIRQNPDNQHMLELFIVGDQLLKGAALNAIEILEYVLSQKQLEKNAQSMQH